MTPLTHQDEHLLRGRAKEIPVVLDNCAAGRVTVVSGPPCIGVTSFLEAGARPALERENCIVVSFQEWPGRSFANNLREKVAAAVRQNLNADFPFDGDDLETILHRGCHQTGRRIVLILDQFEDYIRCHAGTDEGEVFDTELAKTVPLMGAAPLLFGLQDHAIDAFRRYQQLIPNLFGGWIRLGPLSREDAATWMRLEAERRSLIPEPAAVEALVSAPAASVGEGVHPYLFAAGLNRLIEAEIRTRSGAVRASAIQDYGGPDNLILESLDQSLGELSTTHSELFFRWCNILIGPDGRRMSATEQALTEYAGKLNRFVLTLLPQAVSRGLLRGLAVRDSIRYEIARDSMVPMLRHWWKQREAFFLARSRARFRTRSITLAVVTMVVLCVAWLFLSVKK